MSSDDPAWADLGPGDEERLYTRQLGLAFYENSSVLCRLATAQSASSRLYTRIVELLWNDGMSVGGRQNYLKNEPILSF